MTEEEREFCTTVQVRAQRLAGLLLLIKKQVTGPADGRVHAAAAADQAGLLALQLISLAAGRINGAEMAAEVAASGYDLAALATAPPATVEE